eukprot:741435-Rhodomonas_salina.1
MWVAYAISVPHTGDAVNSIRDFSTSIRYFSTERTALAFSVLGIPRTAYAISVPDIAQPGTHCIRYLSTDHDMA